MLQLRETYPATLNQYPRRFDKELAILQENLPTTVTSVLRANDAVSAYHAAIDPITRQWASPWAVLLSFDDGDAPYAACVFSSDHRIIGTRCRADVAAISLFGGDGGVKPAEGKVVSRLYTCLKRDRYAPALIYLPFTHANDRYLLLFRAESSDARPIRLPRDWEAIVSCLVACACSTQKMARINTERADLEMRLDQLLAVQQDLHFRANHDDLTGLPNRSYAKALIESRLEQKGFDGRLALAFVDLDDFKQVNDTYGHAAGDSLLKSVAQRLRSNIRKLDICGRIAGDEFVVCISAPDRQADFKAIFSRLSDLLCQPFEIEGRQIVCSASIGVAKFPYDGTLFESLLRAADASMYRAKARKRIK